MALPERLSLYDEVRSRGYEASIIGTYNLNFHFYERVVLRRLQSSGCRHNIVLADGAQCAEALASGDFHPKLCGSAYTILPIQCASAFHPKFIMLLGRKKARLIVGSHNLTISGFGLNREIATAFDAKPEEASALTARKVWGFVNAWTEGFPREIQQVISSTERISPWLTAFDEDDTQSPLLCSLPSGPSLWNQLRPLLPQKIRRIYIISPFFDSKLAFVRTLMNELNPKECLIAVHHQSTSIPPDAKSLVKGCRFIDVARLRQALEDSGRQTHERCHKPPQTQSPDLNERIVIAIPGDSIGRRTRVTIASRPLDLPNASLKVLLHLMVAQRNGAPVNKVDMGATADQGYKGISILRNDLKPVLGDVDIIKSHYHGDYSFEDNVAIGECAVDKLLKIGDHTISQLARELRPQAPRPAKKV